MSDECSYDLINASPDSCVFVTNNCSGSYINFYMMHYCLFNGYLWITLPVLIIFILICFYLTGNTANKYLSCALTELSNRLKISQNLAGVTFLAFGNGAPDVISSIVAAENISNGIEVSIGALHGAGTFVTSFVLASVVWFAGTVKVNKVLFNRDGILYLFSIGVLSLFSWDGKIVLWESICFFSIYIIYIIVAIIQDRFYKEKEKENNNVIETDDQKMEEKILNEIIHFDEHGNIQKILNNSNDNREKMNVLDEDTNKTYNSSHFYKSMIRNEKFDENLFRPEPNSSKLFEFNLTTLRYRLKKLYFQTKDMKFNQLNIFNKILFIFIDLPFNFFRDLTIPACDLDNWNQTFFCLMPLTCPLYIVSITKTWNIFFDSLFLTIVTPLVILFLIIIFKFTTYRNKLPSLFIPLCLFAFVMSIFWIWFISQFLIDILQTIGTILNIPSVFLAMTILAFGNSVPDLSLNVALARQGFGEMGIAGSIAGPLFNLLIGLGTTLIQNTISESSIPFNIYSSGSLIVTICTIALAVNILRLLIQGYFLKYSLDRSVSTIGFLIYLAFFVLICIYSF